MEKMIIAFDKKGNTLDIWFDNPKKEFLSEETGEELILKKNKKGKIIGIEKLNILPVSKKEISEMPIKLVLK